MTDELISNKIDIVNNLVYTKKIINLIFINYVKYKLKNQNLYDIGNNIIIFNLKYIGNIRNMYDKVYNTIHNTAIQNTAIQNTAIQNTAIQNKYYKLYNSLEYNIYRTKIKTMLENLISLMSIKGYYFKFNYYDYILYEHDLVNHLYTTIGDTIGDILLPIYFIKVKLKKIDNNNNNDNNDNNNNNNMNFNTYTINNDISKMFIFHNKTMFEYYT